MFISILRKYALSVRSAYCVFSLIFLGDLESWRESEYAWLLIVEALGKLSGEAVP